MTKTSAQTMHLRLFEEIIKGKYRPFLPRYADNIELKNILLEALTFTMATLDPGVDPDTFIANTDFLPFGFKEESDFDVQKKNLPGGKTAIVLSPTKIYEGHEILDIPNYTTFKTNVFLQSKQNIPKYQSASFGISRQYLVIR